MTDSEIIIEVAKLDGWYCGEADFGHGIREGWCKGDYSQGGFKGSASEFPAYLTSRDAIITVIEKRDLSERVVVCNYLTEGNPGTHWTKGDVVLILTATPRQLCIALLKSTGKWIE